MINVNPPVDLYLNFEKSSWKTQVRWTGFLTCKNQFRNWFLQATQAVKIKFEIDYRTWFLQLDFSKIKYRWIRRQWTRFKNLLRKIGNHFLAFNMKNPRISTGIYWDRFNLSKKLKKKSLGWSSMSREVGESVVQVRLTDLDNRSTHSWTVDNTP